ncbi:MAG: DUF2997 domain-containing protein [Candidatus Thorarchaeota archaeon]
MSVENVEIEITIDETGNVSYKVKGLKGRGCTKETEFLDEALGEVTKREYTRGYYQEQVKTSARVTTRR